VKKFFITIALLLGASFTLAGCAPSEPVELSEDTVIIDVRTPAEFATGHLDGAVNIDVQSPHFAAQIMELDPNGDYFVYCRSGNRSGQAIAQMNQMGFNGENLTNGGSVQNASDLSGIDIVLP